MGLIWTNFARAKLATPPSGTGGLSFTVEAGKGALFPTLGAGDYCYAVFKNSAKTAAEVVKVEARSTDSFTIAAAGRGLDGTTAASWTANDYVELCVTRIALLEVFNAAVVAIGSLTPAADRYPYFTGATSAALGTITAFWRTVLDDVDAPTSRTTLGAAAAANPVFTGVVTIPDGSLPAPGFRWSSSSTTGLCSQSDNTVRVVCNGNEIQQNTSSYLGLSCGQLKFPSTQNPSSDPNTQDDYEEGTWTPALSFATPGDLSVAYSVQGGAYTKIGNAVHITMDMDTSSFTHTTASGLLQLLNLPFTSANVATQTHSGAGTVSGITKAGYTGFPMRLSPNSSVAGIGAYGSGITASNIAASDMPSGGTVQLRFSMTYRTA